MKKIAVDVAIIGAGSAGLNARREALNHGARRVVVIEAGPLGTTCARVGCMPSKLLIAAADRAHAARTGGEMGVHAEGLRIDGDEVMARLRRERDRFVGFVVKSWERQPDEQHLRGRARFVDETTLEVSPVDDDGEAVRVEADAVVVATGSSPIVPGVFRGLPEGLVMTSDEIFEMETLPSSIAVIGTGVIGLELGQAFHRLGVRTSLFSIEERVGPLTDPRVHEVALEVLGAELELHLGVEVSSVEPIDGGVELTWSHDGKAQTAQFERVLLATGRRPNVGDLGLEVAGVPVEQGRVPCVSSMTMQCGDKPIFLAGDVSSGRPLLHEASDEGHIAGENAAVFPDVRAHRRRTPLTIVFSRPEMALVGATWRELEAMDCDYAVGEVSYVNQGRARVDGENEGLVRIYGSRDRRCFGELLGAEMFGPAVEHTAHLLAWMTQARVPLGEVLSMPFYHPVIEEGIRTALRDLAAKLKIDKAHHPLYDGPGG